MTLDFCKLIKKEIVIQTKSLFWHVLRVAGVTASKAYSVATSSVQSNSAFIMSILYATKIKDTVAMMRGRELKPKILSE